MRLCVFVMDIIGIAILNRISHMVTDEFLQTTF